MDAQGRELWRKTFDKRFQSEMYSASSTLERQFVWFGDLDGDGRTETLFAYHPNDLGQEGSVLLCLSDTGAEKWRFVPGRQVKSPVETFAPPYVIEQFAVAPLKKNGPPAVVVTSSHHLYYPNQVAVLSANGSLLGEYWHSGNLSYLAVADMDHDGVSEIYLGGANNTRKWATLVVLDPDQLGGAAVEDEEPNYQLRGFPPAREKVRLLFPRSCINQKFDVRNSVGRLWVHPESITVGVAERGDDLFIFYHLTPDLKLKDLEYSDRFRTAHAALESSGELDHKLSKEEEAAMRQIRVLRPQLNPRKASSAR